MPRPSNLRRQWPRLICVLVLALLCMNGALACSPRKSSAPPSVAVAADPASAAAFSDGKVSEENREPTETCEGVLNCTFFGLGAVLAAPFWVLGTVLGLTF